MKRFVFTLNRSQDAPCVLEMALGPRQQRLKFLVDTGASTNIICYSALSEKQKEAIEPDNAEIVGVTADALPVIGKISLIYQLGADNIYDQAYVVQDKNLDLRTDGIISRNFLLANKMSLCDVNQKIEFRGKVHNLQKLPRG